jgi:hypothetical protein
MDHEGIIISDVPSLLSFVDALAHIERTELFRVRLVLAKPDDTRVCCISIGERHWICGPVACRAIADMIADFELTAIHVPGTDVTYAPDQTGIVDALRDCALRLEIKRLN